MEPRDNEREDLLNDLKLYDLTENYSGNKILLMDKRIHQYNQKSEFDGI